MALDGTIIAGIIPVCALLGLAFAAYLWKVVAKVQLVGGQNVVRSQNGREYLLVSTGCRQRGRGQSKGDQTRKSVLFCIVGCCCLVCLSPALLTCFWLP